MDMSNSRSGCTRRTRSAPAAVVGRLRLSRPRALRPDRIHLRRLGGGCGRGRFRRPIGGGWTAVSRADRRGRGAHSHHPGRGKRLGTLRRRRPAVPACAVSATVRPPGPSNRDDGRGVRGAGSARCQGSSRGPGSTPTSTSGSVTRTTRKPGVSSLMRGRRSTRRRSMRPPTGRARRARRF